MLGYIPLCNAATTRRNCFDEFPIHLLLNDHTDEYDEYDEYDWDPSSITIAIRFVGLWRVYNQYYCLVSTAIPVTQERSHIGAWQKISSKSFFVNIQNVHNPHISQNITTKWYD